jgi:histidinol-phosphate aminotransferase
MRQYFRSSLVNTTKSLSSYGSRPPATCDLSLVSGPYIWKEEVEHALSLVSDEMVSSYSLPNQNPELLATLAAHDGISPDWIWLAPGADVAIEVVLRQILEPGDRMALLCPGFPRFEVIANTIDGVTTTRHFSIHDLPADPKMIVLCTPCNPTTEEIPLDVLRVLIASRPDTMFCIDGPFDWYAGESLVQLVKEFPNVLLIKSFSKIGLAGLRLGYVVARPEALQVLCLGQSPFSVPALIQAVGLAVARRFDRLPEIHALVASRWAGIEQSLGAHVIRHAPVPFYLLKLNVPAEAGAVALMEEGISVVKGNIFPGLDASVVRVAIGTEAQNALFVDAVHRLGLVG